MCFLHILFFFCYPSTIFLLQLSRHLLFHRLFCHNFLSSSKWSCRHSNNKHFFVPTCRSIFPLVPGSSGQPKALQFFSKQSNFFSLSGRVHQRHPLPTAQRSLWYPIKVVTRAFHSNRFDQQHLKICFFSLFLYS